MNWDAIGAVGEILGAMGVIVTLAYLASQVRNSNQTSRAQSLQSVLDGQRDRSFVTSYTNPALTDLLARGWTDFNKLTDNEKRQFYTYVTEQLFQMQQVMQLRERGLLSRGDFNSWLYYTATLIKTPGGAAVWPYIEVTITPTIRDLINDYMAENPDTPSFIDINPLFRHSGDLSH